MISRLYEFDKETIKQISTALPLGISSHQDNRYVATLVEFEPSKSDGRMKFIISSEETLLDQFESDFSVSPSVDSGRTNGYWQIDSGKFFGTQEQVELAYPGISQQMSLRSSVELPEVTSWTEKYSPAPPSQQFLVKKTRTKKGGKK